MAARMNCRHDAQCCLSTLLCAAGVDVGPPLALPLFSLQRLLDRLELRPGIDVLLSVGDLVNKGPDSRRVLAMARSYKMQARFGARCNLGVPACSSLLAQNLPAQPA